MANHIPDAPADMALTTVRYFAQLPVPSVSLASPLSFDQVQTELIYSAPNISVAFEFTTPGDLGTFDQDTVESLYTQMITTVCGVLAVASGVSLAEMQAQVVITRSWNWANATGGTGAAQDTMTYPPQEAAA